MHALTTERILTGMFLGKQGENYMLYSLVQDGDINPEKAAGRLEITVDELRHQMNEAGYQIPTGA